MASSPDIVGGGPAGGGGTTAGAGFAHGAAAYIGAPPRVVSDMSTIFYLINFECGLGGGAVASPQVRGCGMWFDSWGLEGRRGGGEVGVTGWSV